jgi:hypothetical protein
MLMKLKSPVTSISGVHGGPQTRGKSNDSVIRSQFVIFPTIRLKRWIVVGIRRSGWHGCQQRLEVKSYRVLLLLSGTKGRTAAPLLIPRLPSCRTRLRPEKVVAGLHRSSRPLP